MILDFSIKLKEIASLPLFASVKDALISGGNFFDGSNGEMSLIELEKQNPTWNAKDILFGLNNLGEIITKRKCVFNVYSEEEIASDNELGKVKLLYLPANKPKENEFAILLAGGAYGAVCTMVEAMPVAAQLNKEGINCFCLNYRTANEQSFINGLLPRPLDDLAAALRYIKGRAEFDLDCNNYTAIGFSAGAHVVSLWGTKPLGARRYGVAQARKLILAYPLISMANVPNSPVKQYMCCGMFGKNYTEQDINNYDASRHIDALYPKSYIVKCLDDDTVPQQDDQILIDAMSSYGVRSEIEIGQKGGHGFGLGSETTVKGWSTRAIKWE